MSREIIISVNKIQIKEQIFPYLKAKIKKEVFIGFENLFICIYLKLSKEQSS